MAEEEKKKKKRKTRGDDDDHHEDINQRKSKLAKKSREHVKSTNKKKKKKKDKRRKRRSRLPSAALLDSLDYFKNRRNLINNRELPHEDEKNVQSRDKDCNNVNDYEIGESSNRSDISDKTRDFDEVQRQEEAMHLRNLYSGITSGVKGKVLKSITRILKSVEFTSVNEMNKPVGHFEVNKPLCVHQDDEYNPVSYYGHNTKFTKVRLPLTNVPGCRRTTREMRERIEVFRRIYGCPKYRKEIKSRERLKALSAGEFATEGTEVVDKPGVPIKPGEF